MATVEPVPVAVSVPEGFWERDASHSPKPWTPMLGSVFFDVRDASLRELFATFGLLVETLEFRQIGGWEYARLVPLGGKDRSPPAFLMPESSNRGASPRTVSGIPAIPGRYTGPVRIVRRDTELDRVRAGDVLVCRVAAPVWSIVIPSVGALVTDSGGLLSHSAIIAREYRVPAVVATGAATSTLRDGQVVTVDGTTGQVDVVG